MQTCDVAHEVVEAVAGYPAGGVHVNAVKALHDGGVVRDVELRYLRLAEALHLDIVAVVGSDGDGGVDDVRDEQHYLTDALCALVLDDLKLCEPVRLRLDLCLDLLRLVELTRILLCHAHELSDLLGQCVAGGTKLARLGYRSPVLAVKLQNLVDEGELCVLKLLADVLLDGIRVLSYKLYV